MYVAEQAGFSYTLSKRLRHDCFQRGSIIDNFHVKIFEEHDRKHVACKLVKTKKSRAF